MLRDRLTRLTPVALLALFVVPVLPAEDFFFDSGGVRIHYTVEGSGEPVLLIHGYSVSAATNWGAPGVIKGLSDRYQVIAIDNRGHGQSDKPHDPRAYGDKMAEDSIHLLDHLKIRKAHVVGYSMGGFITSELLTRHPDRLWTATLGGAGWRSPKETEDLKPMFNRLAESLEQGNGIGPLIVALTPPGQQPPPPDQMEAISKRMLAANDPLALAAVVRAPQGQVPEAKIRANKIPVLALIGELDPLKAGVDRLDGMMPNLKIVVIPGATHMTAPGSPVFLTTLKSFLAEHPAPAAPSDSRAR
ncbi:Hydrolase [Candidatus Sulfopaludibacter sp. SbA4]|nr:Hydrolase [Candidatus Sulfopaludibacter sp. SbA4]